MRRYRIREAAALTGLTERSIRYYVELGLVDGSLTDGGQRVYDAEDIVRLKRIAELRMLGFSLGEIASIVSLKSEDESGAKRRSILLSSYRMKLSEEKAKREKLDESIGELEWRIAQLEEAEGEFKACPGSSCALCRFKDKCVFFGSDH